MKRSAAARITAIGLILSLHAVAVPALAQDAAATLSGAILESATQAPLPGARLHVADAKTGNIYSSAPATATGAFKLENVPPATYELAVESGGGLYLVKTPIRLAPGQTETINLAVAPEASPDADGGSESKPGTRRNPWDTPGTAAGIVFGAAVVVGILVNELTNEDAASVSEPQ